jgi:SlyX protein
MQEKIIELESKFSFQEDLLQQLNETVIRQQRQLDKMVVEISHLHSQLSELLANHSMQPGHDQSNEKPPHY